MLILSRQIVPEVHLRGKRIEQLIWYKSNSHRTYRAFRQEADFRNQWLNLAPSVLYHKLFNPQQTHTSNLQQKTLRRRLKK